MNILFTQAAWKDFEWFLDNDKQFVQRIRKLLKDIIRNPEDGIGNPEKLKFHLSGYWSEESIRNTASSIRSKGITSLC